MNLNIFWVLSMLTLASLTACSTREVIYHNHTTERIIEKNCSVCMECPDCICSKCPDYIGPECKAQIKTIITDNCTIKLNLCNLRLDAMNDELFDCMMLNDTQFSDNLTIEFNNCNDERRKLQDRLDNISSLLQ